MANVKPIQFLDPLVAQRIAAGEVIERPASVVRELLDNAIDAQATLISVQIVSGGLERITVVDDGLGISSNDLAKCCLPHATSKIAQLEDLYRLETLGFRGEALYSIAAASKITITSATAEETGATLIVDNGSEGIQLPAATPRGTRVDVEHLFAQIPARRMFLKRPASEATLCRSVFLEKAAAFPNIHFQYYLDEKLSLDLPATDYRQRVLDTLVRDKNVIPSETLELSSQGGNFSLYAVASSPAYYRSDRSQIKIFLNQRLINEYALVQAVTYAYDTLLPGGAFPYCYLFITNAPEMVDFNIHPAKREAKIRNKAEIHHAIVQMVRAQIYQSFAHIPLDRFTSTPTRQPSYPRSSSSPNKGSYRVAEPSRAVDPNWFDQARTLLPTTERKIASSIKPQLRYLGQIFETFLLAEHDSSLYIVDQHAAHERLLYDQLASAGEVQTLLVPYTFEVERDVDLFLQQHTSWYQDYGLEVTRLGDLEWQLHTIPALWKPIESDVVSFIQNRHGTPEDLFRQLYSSIACHKAIKRGDRIDQLPAEELLAQVFQLSEPVCPHGRMFVVEITFEELKKAVGRLL